MVSLFERLNAGRPASVEGAIKPRSRREDPKIFLEDILTNGPAPATLVEERGKARGFTKMQIRHARRQLNIISFKENRKDAAAGIGSCLTIIGVSRRRRQHPPRTFNPHPQRANNSRRAKKAKKAKAAFRLLD